MAEKTNMRLVGAVENMSYLVGSGAELFGSGGGEALAREIGVPLLGKVPLDPALREAADRGEPLVWEQPEAEAAQAIVALAERISVARREEGLGITKPLPLAGARS
jgi:ATP-binding protein involved in chromosome partitioning